MTQNITFNPLNKSTVGARPVVSSAIVNAIDAMRAAEGTVLRQGYSGEELRAIFSLPMFESPSRYGRDQWAPLVALYSGMRASELAALRPQDVRQEAGTWVFDIPAVKFKERRLVPLHEQLIELDLVRYAAERQGDDTLFGWRSGAELIKWFAKLYSEANGTPNAGDAYGRYRHTLLTALRASPVADLIAGHIDGPAVRDLLSLPIGDRLRIMSKTLNGVAFAA